MAEKKVAVFKTANEKKQVLEKITNEPGQTEKPQYKNIFDKFLKDIHFRKKIFKGYTNTLVIGFFPFN